MGRIQQLSELFKDAHGRYPSDSEELFSWNSQRTHESMKGGERPTTALVVVASDIVALALMAIIIL